MRPANRELPGAGDAAELRERVRELEARLACASECLETTCWAPAPPTDTLEDLRRRVDESDLVLRQVHERVRNQLQMISSLLFLESRRLDDPRLSAAIESSRDRIRVLAMASDHTPQSPQRVELAAYVESVLVSLGLSHGHRALGVRIERRLEPCSADHDVAVAVGLIVSELVGHALAQAFPDGRAGLVRVELRADGPGAWRLALVDDGVVEPPGPRALGIEIAQRLARQLGSQLQIGAGPGGTGSSFAVRFEA